MDPALAAALRPLASAPRLRDLEARLLAASVVDVRVAAELLRADGYETIADLLGIEEDFTEAETVLIEAFLKKAGVSASVQKRIRGEETHWTKFRESVANLADGFCSDVFGTAHRAHSSMMGDGYAVKCSGFLVAEGVGGLRKGFGQPRPAPRRHSGRHQGQGQDPAHQDHVEQGQYLIIGGGMTFTFFEVLHGTEIGKSLDDEEGAKPSRRSWPRPRRRASRSPLPLTLFARPSLARVLRSRWPT